MAEKVNIITLSGSNIGNIVIKLKCRWPQYILLSIPQSERVLA
jgi:hypothetical protein